MLTDLYSLHDDVLGEGALSSVHTCIEKASGEEFAVKVCMCVRSCVCVCVCVGGGGAGVGACMGVLVQLTDEACALADVTDDVSFSIKLIS